MQAFFNFLLTSYYLYITIRHAPMHRTWLNCVNSFLALFPWWAASLAFIGVFYTEASGHKIWGLTLPREAQVPRCSSAAPQQW